MSREVLCPGTETLFTHSGGVNMKKKFNKNSNYSMAHVLYQKLGSDWFAFTEVDGDCFMSKVDPETVNPHAIKNAEETSSSQSNINYKRSRAA